MAVQISGNDITVPRDGTFSRNVSIAGTLTYEDVTNVDSIGLVTARNGIEVGASPGVAASISVDGNMIVSGVTTFNGSDVLIGTGITLSPDGDASFTGIVTFNGADVLIGTGISLSKDGDVSFTGISTLGKGAVIKNTTAGDGDGARSSFIKFQGTQSGGEVSDLVHIGALHDGTNDDQQGAFRVYVNDGNDNAAPTERFGIGQGGEFRLSGANIGSSGQVLTSQGSGSPVYWATPAGATSGTYTSFGTGYYVDITTTSTNVVKYDILFTGVSCGGGTDWQFQLGDSGGVEGSGYEVVATYRSHNASNNTNNRSDAFRWHGTGSGSFIMDGKFSLTRIHNNKWFGEGLLVRTEAGSTIYDMVGTKELSGALTTIRISSSSDDSEVFDGGYYKVIEYTGTV